MKRLLTYLFIVLGLGLTFNVNAKTKLEICYSVGWNMLTLEYSECSNFGQLDQIKGIKAIVKDIKENYQPLQPPSAFGLVLL